MTSQPYVSVIMPVFNDEKYVAEAIESILHQTHNNFELIIIDDASSDHTIEIIDKYITSDNRVRLFKNEKHLGIAKSRNRGNSLARGEFIAVMDHDDISLPERFERQVEYLRANPSIVAVGTNYIEIDEYGKSRNFQSKYSELPGVMRWRMFFGIQFLHPTIMIRKSVLTQENFEYDEKFDICPDYDLFFRISRKYKISNMPDVLYQYRRHATNTFFTRQSLTHQEDSSIITKNINTYLNTTLPEDFGYGMKDSLQIKSIQDAVLTSKIVIRLFFASQTWDNHVIEKAYIRRSASGKLRTIWHSQQNNLTLLPYVLFSLIIYPGVIKIWLKKVLDNKR